MSQRFQLWLIGAMSVLALSLAVLWLWNEAILQPLVQVGWAIEAVVVCPLAWWRVCRGFNADGKFLGWRALLWRSR